MSMSDGPEFNVCRYDHTNARLDDTDSSAPDLSTSNRATIGGMINTDASGQGSTNTGKLVTTY